MGFMPDENSAALRIYEAEQVKGELAMEQAERERPELIAEFIDDERGKNERDLLDYLGDLAGGSTGILRQIQRIKRAEKSVMKDDIGRDTVIQAALQIAKLFTDCIDSAMGNKLVDKRAGEL